MASSGMSLRRLVLLALASGLSLAAIVAIAAILVGSFDGTDARLIATSLGFSLFSALGAAGVGARRGRRALADLGAATAGGASAGFALLLIGLWAASSEGVWRAFAILSFLTLAASHACLVLGARRENDSPLVGWLTAASVGAGSLDAMLSAFAVSGVAEQVGGDYLRLIAVLVIVLLLTSALPPILRRLAGRAAMAPGGLPGTPLPATIGPTDDRTGDLLAIAQRLEELAPAAGGIGTSIASEAARLRRLAG
ncbi:MAG TPA: hypothetical protein VES97_00570 [Solirubrobacteraceae bacterium]|nr:hypothetical protein [Solirubrobacteraceae bacterium]